MSELAHRCQRHYLSDVPELRIDPTTMREHGAAVLDLAIIQGARLFIPEMQLKDG